MMQNLHKCAAILLVVIFTFSINFALAGGSGLMWEVKGSQVKASPGEVTPKILNLHIEANLPPDAEVESLRIEKVRLSCDRGDLLSTASISLDPKHSSKSSFVKRNNAYEADLSRYVIRNNSVYDFPIRLTIKPNIRPPVIVHCFIKSLALTDPQNGQQIYHGSGDVGYVFVGKNEASTIMIQ